MSDGHRLVSHWDQVLGEKPDGGQWIVPGLSILYYAGDGLESHYTAQRKALKQARKQAEAERQRAADGDQQSGL